MDLSGRENHPPYRAHELRASYFVYDIRNEATLTLATLLIPPVRLLPICPRSRPFAHTPVHPQKQSITNLQEKSTVPLYLLTTITTLKTICTAIPSSGGLDRHMFRRSSCCHCQHTSEHRCRGSCAPAYREGFVVGVVVVQWGMALLI